MLHLIKESYKFKMCLQSQLSAAHLFSCPLETSHHAVLDLVEVLNPLCHVYQQVGPSSVWTEAPDLPGFCHLPLILVSEVTRTSFELLPCGDIPLLNVFSQAVGEGTGLHEETIVLVWGLGETHLV